MKANTLTIREICLFGILGALTFGAKYVMSWMPNIEPVSLMVMLFAVTFGIKCLFPVYLYVLLEVLFYGLGTWNINYFYVWPILAILALVMRKIDNPLGWALLSGVFGLLFGLLCSPVDMFIGGLGYALSKWSMGVMFDIFHCIGNFVIALLAFVPLRKLLTQLYREKLPRKYRNC